MSTPRELHVGEAGVHKGHDLDLLTDGTVYCCDCEKPLSAASADVAWPPEYQSAEQILAASDLYMAEHPRVPSEKEISEMQKLHTVCAAYAEKITAVTTAWGCRMFLKTEPEVPEAVKAQMWNAIGAEDADVARRHNVAVLAAFELGRKAGPQ